MVCEDGNQARVAGRYSSQRPVSHLPSLLWNTEYFYMPGHLLVNRATFHLKGLIDNKQIHMAVSSCWNEEKLSGQRMEGMRAWSSLKGRSRKASWSRWQWSQDLPPRRGAWHGASWVKVTAHTQPWGVVIKGSPRKARARSQRAQRSPKDFGFYSKCEEKPVASGGPWSELVSREQEWGQGDRSGGRRHGVAERDQRRQTILWRQSQEAGWWAGCAMRKKNGASLLGFWQWDQNVPLIQGGPGLEAGSGKVKSGPQFWAWNIWWRKKESPGWGKQSRLQV